ncbi:MAG: HTH domain-containing protein [Solobacterium sp.]|nr:HTH domain-containing protein [Solobacterium sp.]
MKTDRLIGILSVLLQEEQTTAPKLVEIFEVSRRTINRDIETLCMAGSRFRPFRAPAAGSASWTGTG